MWFNHQTVWFNHKQFGFNHQQLGSKPSKNGDSTINNNRDLSQQKNNKKIVLVITTLHDEYRDWMSNQQKTPHVLQEKGGSLTILVLYLEVHDIGLPHWCGKLNESTPILSEGFWNTPSVCQSLGMPIQVKWTTFLKLGLVVNIDLCWWVHYLACQKIGYPQIQ